MVKIVKIKTTPILLLGTVSVLEIANGEFKVQIIQYYAVCLFQTLLHFHILLK